MSIVVVAKYTEDVSWTLLLPPGWKVHVYDKGPGGAFENVGREAETYARFVVDRYDSFLDLDPATTVLFLQGHPFDHSCDIDDIVRHGSAGVRECTCIGVQTACGPDGAPHHTGLRVAESHALLGLDPTPTTGTWTFCVGAQFAVPVAKITQRPKEFWTRLHAALARGDICPWTMERLWLYVFS